MYRNSLTIAVAALLSAALGTVSVAADIYGHNKVTVPAKSDAVVSVPFVRPSVGAFSVVSASAGTITVADNTLIAHAYEGVFYVRITSGAAKGRWSTVTTNTHNTLTLQNTDLLTSATDTFELIPHQTLGSVFPDEYKGISFVASDDLDVHTMEVFLPNTTSVGKNKAPSSTFYYYQGAWRKVGDEEGKYDNQILSPDDYFIVRNRTTSSLTFIASGKSLSNIDQGRVLTVGAANDIPASTGHAIGVTLVDLKLTTAFAESLDVDFHKDELWVYVNGPTGYNRAPSKTYFYFEGAWRDVNDGGLYDPEHPELYPDRGGDVLPPGTAFLIRKASGSAGSQTWIRPAN